MEVPAQTRALILIKMSQQECIDVEAVASVALHQVPQLRSDIGGITVRIVRALRDFAVDEDPATALQCGERHIAVADLKMRRRDLHGASPGKPTPAVAADGANLPASLDVLVLFRAVLEDADPASSFISKVQLKAYFEQFYWRKETSVKF